MPKLTDLLRAILKVGNPFRASLGGPTGAAMGRGVGIVR